MKKHFDDQRIAAEFGQLRQAELELTPRVSNLLRRASNDRPRFGLLRPSVGLATVTLTLSIIALILLRPDYNDNYQLSSVYDMPTDFLLETPWPQLASLGPADQLLDLPDDLPEDLSYEP